MNQELNSTPFLESTLDKRSLSINSDGFTDLCLNLLAAGISLRFTAHGSSMQPLVRDGDILQVEPAQGHSLRLGMVVLCLVSPGRVVAHRIVKRKGDHKQILYLVQGDHVDKPDGWFRSQDIIGEIASIERSGIPINFQSPQARVLARLAVLKSLSVLKNNRPVYRTYYSKIKQMPLFKVFFS